MFLKGEQTHKGPGSTLYPLLLILCFHEEYAQTGITRSGLMAYTKWQADRATSVINQAYRRGFLERAGRIAGDSGKWRRDVIRLTEKGRHGACALLNSGYRTGFDDDGRLELQSREDL